MEEEIFKRSLGVDGGRGVLCASLRSCKPNVADLVLSIHGDRLVRKLVHNSLVCLNGCVIGALFLPSQTDIELRPGGIFSVGRSSDHVGENSYSTIQCRANRNAKELQLLPVKINFTDSELRLDCFVEMRTAGIFFD